MLIKSFIIIAFILIVVSLASALRQLMQRKEGETSDKMFKSLVIRVGLSISLFIFIVVIYATGTLEPQGIGARMQYLKQHPEAQQAK